MKNSLSTAILALALAFTHGFSQGTANVPVIANLNATVSIQPSDCPAGNVGNTLELTANQQGTLTLSLSGSSTDNPSSSSGGTDPILPIPSMQTGTTATYQLFSLSGKRLDISRQNMPQGVYLLVARENGKTSTSKIAHAGGKLNLNAATGGKYASPNVLRKNGVCTWTLTATAEGYEAVSFDFVPKSGANTVQNIVFAHPLAPQPMTTKTALQYFVAEDVKMGWNLGAALESVSHWTTPMVTEETIWGNPRTTKALIDGVKAQGFDIVRIPVTYINLFGDAPDYTISEAKLRRVAEVVNWVHNAGMKAIINIHEDGHGEPGKATWGFLKFTEVQNGTASNEQVKDQFGKAWTQIANYFKNYGDYLIFEVMNEVHSGDWGTTGTVADQDRHFEWKQAALDAIRATGGNNATRFVAVPGLGGTEPAYVLSAHSRGKLLPNDGANGTKKLIVAVHFYAPAQYTVAEATPSQGGDGWYLKHTLTSAELAAIDTEAHHLKETFFDNGIAVYYGEWGAPTDTRSSMDATIKNTHIDYISRVAKAARANGIVPIYWDNGSAFKILERSNGIPKPGLWADVLTAMKTSISTTAPPTLNPPTITANLGDYELGLDWDDEGNSSTNYNQAVWELSAENIARAQTTGAKLVLTLSSAPIASLQFVWQNADAAEADPSFWWKMKEILGELGDVLNASDAVWNAGAKTLTINLSAADDYSSFASATSLNFIIAYYGTGGIADLGIVGANLEYLEE